MRFSEGAGVPVPSRVRRTGFNPNRGETGAGVRILCLCLAGTPPPPQSKDGGSRPGPRGGSSRSTPPRDAIRARIALARFRGGGLRPTASHRRAFTSSSRLRIAMLATGPVLRSPMNAILGSLAMQSSRRSGHSLPEPGRAHGLSLPVEMRKHRVGEAPGRFYPGCPAKVTVGGESRHSRRKEQAEQRSEVFGGGQRCRVPAPGYDQKENALGPFLSEVPASMSS